MIKAKIATIEKFRHKFTLVNPENDISIEKLCSIFGERTIKVNSFSSNLFQIEALNGIENHLNIDEIRNVTWSNIEIK